MAEIHKAAARRRLAPRNAPYWRQIAGGWVGYRKSDDAESWVAKYRDPDTGRRTNKTIGKVMDLSYADAEDAARQWLQSMTQGTGSTVTVRDAVIEYIGHLEITRDESRAKDAVTKLRPAIDTDFGKRRLDRLRTLHLEQYLQSLAETRSRATANRMFRSLKAALNRAYRQGHAPSDVAWKTVSAFPTAERRRDVYLTTKQRAALIDAATPDLADYIVGMLLTFSRAGDLRQVRRDEFDESQGVVNLKTAKGRDSKERWRAVPLTKAGMQLFKRRATDKLPAALMFTNGSSPWNKMSLNRAFKVAVTKAKLPPGTVLTNLRHAAITDAVNAGMPLHQVAQISGTSLAMIAKHYGQTIADESRRQLEALDLIG